MPQLPGDTNLYLVNDIDTMMEMKRWLSERRDVMALDTETSGLYPNAPGAKLRLIQIGDHKTGWAIPAETWGGAALECMNNWRGKWTLHNAAFDARWLEIHAGWKMPWDRTDDTLIMGQLERPGERNDLKYLATKFVDPRSDAGQKDLKDAMAKNGWDWATIPVDFPAYYLYSALDPVISAHLWSHFRTDMKFPEAYDLEMSYRRITTEMEMKGMKIDVDYCIEKEKELGEYVDRSKEWAQENFGISIGSNNQLADYLYHELGAKFDVFTGTGNPSVNKEQLDIFKQHDDPRVRQMAEFVVGVRKADKLRSSYFKNFIEMNQGGILYPSIMTMAAKTGRSSVKNPALQTLPSNDSLVRGAFVPRNPGEILVSCDFSQVELRLLAHYTEDEALQKAFRDADALGEDFFVNMGKQVYRDPEFNKEDPRRKLIKSSMYGMAYGGGAEKIAATAKVGVREMTEVLDSIHKTYPGIKRFMAHIDNIGKLHEKDTGRPYIETSTGRKLYCEKGKIYSLLNFRLQGEAAEALKKSVIRLDAAGFGKWMLLPVHDEIIFSIPEAEVERSLPEIQSIMSYCNGEYAVDLPAEPEVIGLNWGAKYAKK